MDQSEWTQEFTLLWIELMEEQRSLLKRLENHVEQGHVNPQEIQALLEKQREIVALQTSVENSIREKILNSDATPKESNITEEENDSSMKNVTFDGLQLHEMLVANSHKHFGMANVSSIVSKRKRTSISSFKGRKRSYNSAVRQAKKVLDNRKRPDGSQEYLIKWAKSTEKTWISRDLCSGDIKDLIDEYIREHAKLQIQPAEECIVDRIVMAGMWKGKKHYLVKWEGYGSEEDTWEAEDSLRADVPNIVEEFERNCKDSPVELE